MEVRGGLLDGNAIVVVPVRGQEQTTSHRDEIRWSPGIPQSIPGFLRVLLTAVVSIKGHSQWG